mmetsp:Transcript_99815/g.320287  ORF Transcript_99815/g.320287 Transcript_99815/m.320287 type:complete len:247 (-) Transcript_99815:1121-1861(-)
MRRRRPSRAAQRRSTRSWFPDSSESSASLPPKHNDSSLGITSGHSSNLLQNFLKPSLPKAQQLMSIWVSCCQEDEERAGIHSSTDMPMRGLLKSSTAIKGSRPKASKPLGPRSAADTSKCSAQPASAMMPSSPMVLMRTPSFASRPRPRAPDRAPARNSTEAAVSSQDSKKSSRSGSPRFRASARASTPSSPTVQPSRRKRRSDGGAAEDEAGRRAAKKASTPSAPKRGLPRKSKSSTPAEAHRPT